MKSLQLVSALLSKKNDFEAAQAGKLDLKSPSKVLRFIPSSLQTFSEAVQWLRGDNLPPTYFQVQGFSDCLELMTRRDFPFKPLGLVHIRNQITVVAPLQQFNNLKIQTYANNIQPHRRGFSFDFVTLVSRDNEEVYRATATNLAILNQKNGQKAREITEETTLSPDENWHFASDAGRKYAKVSGDYNPIHLYQWSARLFGFKSAIAHGMYCKARCLSALPSNLFKTPYSIDVNFYSPVLLPAKPVFSTQQRTASEMLFSLHSGTKKHLYGSISRDPQSIY